MPNNPKSLAPQPILPTTMQNVELQLVSITALRDLVFSIAPDQQLESDVETLLMDVAEEFMGSILRETCKLVKHRQGQTLETTDVYLHLERCWNTKVPAGHSSQELRIDQPVQQRKEHL
jgi:transcription initiation factor TFIID subunit 12